MTRYLAFLQSIIFLKENHSRKMGQLIFQIKRVVGNTFLLPGQYSLKWWFGQYTWSQFHQTLRTKEKVASAYIAFFKKALLSFTKIMSP